MLTTFFHAVHSLDVRFLLAANSVVGRSPLLDMALKNLGDNALWIGGPLFFSIYYLWFSDTGPARRERIYTGLFAVALAATLSLSFQSLFYVHDRPFLDSNIDLKLADPSLMEQWGHPNCFPSDTAAFFFSFALVIGRESRVLGLLSFAWIVFINVFVRVALGWHYLSDVCAGFALGWCCVFGVVHSGKIRIMIRWFLGLFRGREPVLQSLFFLFLADMFTRFKGLAVLFSGVVKAAHWCFAS
jgi:membrane-associated phospholipid phosphatase